MRRIGRGTDRVAAIVACAAACAVGHAGLLHEASLRNGDYGNGAAIDTMGPNHGGSPHNLGITDGADGVLYSATETDGRSNALINWVMTPTQRANLRQRGTISLWAYAQVDNFHAGEMIGENSGYNTFRNGQGTFSSYLSRYDGGDDADYAGVGFKSWHGGVWQFHNSNDQIARFEMGEWVNIGLAWGNAAPDGFDFEIWINGELARGHDLEGLSFPWGHGSSGVNIGLGGNHERGYSAYASAAGIMYRDIRIWDEYRAFGDTVPVPGVVTLLGIGGVLVTGRRRSS
jgi:hypothetical protein